MDRIKRLGSIFNDFRILEFLTELNPLRYKECKYLQNHIKRIVSLFKKLLKIGGFNPRYALFTLSVVK